MTYRLLPEWYPQDGIQLTWPRPDGDWAPLLERIEATLERIVMATARYQRVLICVPDELIKQRLTNTFDAYGVPPEHLQLIVAPTDDTWARDHGPISVVDEDGQCVLLDYTFTGWGGNSLPNAITVSLSGLPTQAPGLARCHREIWYLKAAV